MFADLPEEMQRTVVRLKKARNKRKYVRRAYDILTRKYCGRRFHTLMKLHYLFSFNLRWLWKKEGVLICTNMNHLMRVLLLKSGLFKKEDIKLKWTLIWYVSPHQYLRVRITRNEYVNIDIWGRDYGIKFGDYAKGFK